MTKKAIILIQVLILCCGVGWCEDVFSVNCFFGWDRCYRPMQWTPVNVGITSTLTEPFQGILTVTAQQDGLNNLVIQHEFVLTPNMRLEIPLITKFAYGAERCSVRITTPKGKTVWAKSYDLWDYSQNRQIMQSLSENDLMVGLVGQRKYGILKLEKETACKYGQSVGQVYVKDKPAAGLPWDWTGYDALDVLVLYDADLSGCHDSQLEAMEQWVRNGGKVLMIVSSNPLLRENPLTASLPFKVADATQQAISPGVARRLELSLSGTEEAVVWPLKTNDSKLCDFVEMSDESAFFGVGYCGFGRVGVLSFDPSTLAAADKQKSSEFWIHLLSSVLVDSTVRDLQPELPEKPQKKNYMYSHQFQYNLNEIQTLSMRDIIPAPKEEEKDNQYGSYYSHRYAIGLEQAASNTVMEYLLNIPQMRPLSIWWVILLLVFLAVLLGPVDYLVLKKMDRQPLTWLTCGFWIVLFTVGAYYGVQALRSGELQYRSVSVTDAIGADPAAWSATHAGLFAPKSDRYQLEGIGGGQWWSAVSPEQREIYSYRSQNNATRNVYCMQVDGANVPYALPVNIWTMQCLLCEEPVNGFPIRATVQRQGSRVTAEISNMSDTPVDKGYILFDEDKMLEFEGLAPLASRTVEGTLKERRMWDHNSNNNYSESIRFHESILNTEEAYIAKGSLNRTKALGAMLRRGAAVVCAEMNTQEAVVGVKEKECQYTNRKLYRLVVFPDEL